MVLSKGEAQTERISCLKMDFGIQLVVDHLTGFSPLGTVILGLFQLENRKTCSALFQETYLYDWHIKPK